MKIGINCFNINPRYITGINTFTFDLLDGFAAAQTDHAFFIFIKEGQAHLYEKYKSISHCTIVSVKDASKIGVFYRGLAILPRSKKFYKVFCNIFYRKVAKKINSYNCDVLYTPSNFLFPYNINAKTIISVHDIQHIQYPWQFSKFQALNRKIHFELSAANANFFLVNNEHLKKELAQKLNIRPEKIFTVNECIDTTAFSQRQGNLDILKKYNLPNEFLFFPAQFLPHKNHITVLRALLLLNEMYNLQVPLVLIGTKSKASDTMFDFINKNKMKDVFNLGSIPFEDIISLFQSARYVITASLHESSSLPILEAIAAGTPVIASKIPGIEELSEKFKVNLFEAQDHEALAALLLKIWSDSSLRQMQTHHNDQIIGQYERSAVVDQYETLFNTLAE